jgi:hypothetical protein
MPKGKKARGGAATTGRKSSRKGRGQHTNPHRTPTAIPIALGDVDAGEGSDGGDSVAAVTVETGDNSTGRAVGGSPEAEGGDSAGPVAKDSTNPLDSVAGALLEALHELRGEVASLRKEGTKRGKEVDSLRKAVAKVPVKGDQASSNSLNLRGLGAGFINSSTKPSALTALSGLAASANRSLLGKADEQARDAMSSEGLTQSGSGKPKSSLPAWGPGPPSAPPRESASALTGHRSAPNGLGRSAIGKQLQARREETRQEEISTTQKDFINQMLVTSDSVTRYVDSRNMPAQAHCTRELRTLAPAIDAILGGNIELCFSILTGRSASVMAATRRGGNWDYGPHLEHPITREALDLGSDLMKQAAKSHKAERSVIATQDTMKEALSALLKHE